MFHNAAVLLFAITTGFTASGIASNLYRLIVGERKEGIGRSVYYASLIVAGPSVLFENAAKAWRENSRSKLAFWLAAAVAGYWSLAIGLFIIEVALAL
jgi:hypothetical protein